MQSNTLIDPNRSYENTAAEIYKYLLDTEFEVAKKLMEKVCDEYSNPNYYFQKIYSYSRSTRSESLKQTIDNVTKENLVQTIAAMLSEENRGWYDDSFNPSLLRALIKHLPDFDPEKNVDLDKLEIVKTCFLEQVTKPLQETLDEIERKTSKLKEDAEKLKEQFLESAIMVEETQHDILENLGKYEQLMETKTNEQNQEIIVFDRKKQKKDKNLESLEYKLNELIIVMNSAKLNYDSKLRELETQQKSNKSKMIKINEKLEQLHTEKNNSPSSMQNTTILNPLQNIPLLVDKLYQISDPISISPWQQSMDMVDDQIIESALYRESIFDSQTTAELQKTRLDLLKKEKEKLEKTVFGFFSDRDRSNDTETRKKYMNRFQGLMQNKMGLSIFATSPKIYEESKQLLMQGGYSDDPFIASLESASDDEEFFYQGNNKKMF